MDEAKRQQAERYRFRAKELRMVAGAMTHIESRNAVMNLADSYERLALMIHHDRTPAE